MSSAEARVYLDNASTTAMLPAARDAWFMATQSTGNPSSLHASGRRARQVVEEAREQIAADLRTRPSAVVFTSGGTESDNLAIKGIAWARRRAAGVPMRILTSAIEHHAVLDPVRWLVEHDEFAVTWLGVDSVGRVDVAEVAAALDEADLPIPALCSVMWANNEIGTVQPVAQIAQLCRERAIPFHTDAVQVLGQLPMDLGALGADAVTITSHKIGGPWGVGALILDPALEPTPLLHGGGQERDVRSGSIDAPSIAGFAVAVHHAVTQQPALQRHLQGLRNELITGVLATVPGAILNGDPDLHGAGRLPGNAHFTFPGCQGDALLLLLDAAGIDCSTGSACTAGIPQPSHVLLALGADEATARGSLRFSLGAGTTSADINRLLEVLPGAVERAARAGTPRR